MNDKIHRLSHLGEKRRTRSWAQFVIASPRVGELQFAEKVTIAEHHFSQPYTSILSYYQRRRALDIRNSLTDPSRIFTDTHFLPPIRIAYLRH